MIVSTKSTVKLANEKTGHVQVIGISLFRFPSFPIKYPVGQVYYFQGYHSNTISLGALKYYVGFQKATSEPLEHCDFVDPTGRSWISTYQT